MSGNVPVHGSTRGGGMRQVVCEMGQAVWESHVAGAGGVGKQPLCSPEASGLPGLQAISVTR